MNITKSRRGYTLILVIMLIFGLMGMGALVVDFGYIRLTQQQMQTAVDSAALEGLRWRDDATAGGTGEAPDLYRRQQASTMVANVFDDDLDPNDGDPQNFGAGPVIEMTGGVDPQGIAASQLMTVANPPVYKPVQSDGVAGLELNQATNAVEGDMVAGTFNFGAISSLEDNDYQRADFSSSASVSGSGANAFLVRMRRTGNAGGLDDEAGISSCGPTLPLLFGRGSLINTGSTGFSPRAQGITVRATAIAAAVPAMSVGLAYSANNGLTATSSAQIAPLAIRSDIWAQLNAAGGGPVAINLSNYLAAGGNGSGILLLAPNFSASLTSVGEPITTTTTDAALAAVTASAVYVPIYEDLPSQAETIVGYAYYTNWSYTAPVLTLNPAPLTARIGPQNVSSVIAYQLPAGLASADINQLFNDHANLVNPLYAPALVNRALGGGSP